MKKNNEIRNIGMVRKWFLFLLIAPGIFLAIWFYNQSGQAKLDKTVVLPKSFLEGGVETKIDKGLIKIGESNQAITSDNIKLPMNSVTVEPGFSLMAFPVYLSQLNMEIKWRLVDEKGRSYELVKVDQKSIAELIKEKGGVKTPQLYLLFKPRSGEKYYYLLAEISGKKLAWRFAT